MPSRVRTKDFVSILDFEPAELESCLALAARVKRERALGKNAPTANALGGAHVALPFEKPSLPTISTFETAVRELGGDVITPSPVAALSEREPAVDVARNLERWVKCVVMRTYAHSTLLEFAKAAPRLHVVNALSDTEHPCQALADLQTLKEVWGEWAGRTVTFVGDGNNVATSLAQGAVMSVVITLIYYAFARQWSISPLTLILFPLMWVFLIWNIAPPVMTVTGSPKRARKLGRALSRKTQTAGVYALVARPWLTAVVFWKMPRQLWQAYKAEKAAKAKKK